MSDICKNAITFLQKKFPSALIQHQEKNINNSQGVLICKFYSMMALDHKSGIKQRVIAIENLGSNNELLTIASSINTVFSEMNEIYVKMDNSINPTGHAIDTNQMLYSPRLILYTNLQCIPITDAVEIFNTVNTLIDIIDESKINKTLFISYGGTDQSTAIKINKMIKSHGIQTWFFVDDAAPGEKLHRMMHDGVNNYDKVLLICSKDSLTRTGVLNEIERVLEREAKEGGSEILIPVTLDEYVYSEWAPKRSDLSNQVRSRVITKINPDDKDFTSAIEKIVKVLKK